MYDNQLVKHIQTWLDNLLVNNGKSDTFNSAIVVSTISNYCDNMFGNINLCSTLRYAESIISYKTANDEFLPLMETAYINNDMKAMLMYNYGKAIMYSTSKKEENTYKINEDRSLNKSGEFITAYGDLSYSIYKELLKEFAKDNVDTSVSPIIAIHNYFKNVNDVNKFNHATIFVPMLNAIHYTCIGFFMSNMTKEGFNTTFDYGSDSETSKTNDIKLSDLVKSGVNEDKFVNLIRLAAIYNVIIEHIENGIGIKFNERFSNVIRSIGKEYCTKFDGKYLENKSAQDLILEDKFGESLDTIYLIFKEITNSIGEFYIGDHYYDFRKFYFSCINRNDVKYTSYLLELDEKDTNLDYVNIKLYKEKIDCHAYERAIKAHIINTKKILSNKVSSKQYIKLFIENKFLERIIAEACTYWSKLNKPLLITGVDDIGISNTLIGGRTNTIVSVGIMEAPWTVAYARAMSIVESANARYMEAFEFNYYNNANSSSSSSEDRIAYYKRLESYKPTNQFDNATDNIRQYCSNKLPYLATINVLTDNDISVYLNNNMEDINYSSIKKILKIDIDYSESSKKSLYDIAKDSKYIDSSYIESSADVIKSAIINATDKELVTIIR